MSPELSIPSSPMELHTSSAEIEAIPETPCSSRLGSQTKEKKLLLPKQKGNKQVINWPSDYRLLFVN
jgi:hypothetical protein